MDKALVEKFSRAVAKAWQERDPASAAALFRRTSSYFENPFTRNVALEPRGIERIWEAVLDQSNVHVNVKTLAVEDPVACVAYEAEYESHGQKIKSAGIWVIEFSGDDCVGFRMYSESDDA